MSEIVQGMSELILALCAVVGGWLGWKKWSDEKALKRSKAIDSLLERFNNNELRKLVCTIDSSGGASELIRGAMSEAEGTAKLKVEDSLMFVALLCQLKSSGVITSAEFLLFNDSIMKILDDDDVKAYISQAVADSGLEAGETHYASLMKFAYDHGINMDIKVRDDDTLKAEFMKPNVDERATLSPSRPIHETEFDVPTAIIKINRKYRENMNDDEVRKAVGGWWRLRIDVAQKVKLVLAVANGYVKGVYSVEKWIPASAPEEVGRIGFIGHPADEVTRKKFMGRSSKALFGRGAANPVRYFNVK
ncbi:MAG: hypothetical protein IJL17_01505 [Kiritimatiellae bacterium]|nr:hypothetical protein [Kiritimatiellia bacterium]